jgi:hypothetical protein
MRRGGTLAAITPDILSHGLANPAQAGTSDGNASLRRPPRCTNPSGNESLPMRQVDRRAG